MIKDLQWRTKLLIAFVLFTMEGFRFCSALYGRGGVGPSANWELLILLMKIIVDLGYLFYL